MLRRARKRRNEMVRNQDMLIFGKAVKESICV